MKSVKQRLRLAAAILGKAPTKCTTASARVAYETDKSCMKKYKNDDGTFKGKKGERFENCVKAFTNCADGVRTPDKLCAYIGRASGKIAARRVAVEGGAVKGVLTWAAQARVYGDAIAYARSLNASERTAYLFANTVLQQHRIAAVKAGVAPEQRRLTAADLLRTELHMIANLMTESSDPMITREAVAAMCPACATKMASMKLAKVRLSVFLAKVLDTTEEVPAVIHRIAKQVEGASESYRYRLAWSAFCACVDPGHPRCAEYGMDWGKGGADESDADSEEPPETPSKKTASGGVKDALLDLYQLIVGGFPSGNPHTKKEVKNAIRALGGDGFDLPDQVPHGEMERALYDLVALVTKGSISGNPHTKREVKDACKALGGDGVDLPSRLAAGVTDWHSPRGSSEGPMRNLRFHLSKVLGKQAPKDEKMLIRLPKIGSKVKCECGNKIDLSNERSAITDTDETPCYTFKAKGCYCGRVYYWYAEV